MSKTKLLKIFLFFLLIGILLYPSFTSFTSAAGGGIGAIKGGLIKIAGDVELKIGGDDPDLITVVGKIIKYLLTFLGAAFIILIIYAGGLWMFSVGEPKRVTKAKDIIKNAVIGLTVIILSYVIVSFVLTIIEKAK